MYLFLADRLLVRGEGGRTYLALADRRMAVFADVFRHDLSRMTAGGAAGVYFGSQVKHVFSPCRSYYGSSAKLKKCI